MAELADALDSKSSEATRAGSTPATGIKKRSFLTSLLIFILITFHIIFICLQIKLF